MHVYQIQRVLIGKSWIATFVVKTISRIYTHGFVTTTAHQLMFDSDVIEFKCYSFIWFITIHSFICIVGYNMKLDLAHGYCHMHIYFPYNDMPTVMLYD